jgi:hypothetical protein
MSRQSLLNLLSMVNLGVVSYDPEARERPRRVSPVQSREQVEEEPGGFAIPHTLCDGPCANIYCPSQVALLKGESV